MKENISAYLGAFRAELIQMNRSHLLIALALIQAVTFLLLVSLFGLTGSRAPTALINNDAGPYSKIFINNLEHAHDSFALKTMTTQEAQDALQHGKLVAIITIPSNFSRTIEYGQTSPIDVAVDNIDADLTDDIQRALPSAIVSFGHTLSFPNIRVNLVETDLLSHDTGFIPYLVVSALALDAFVLVGILSAIAVAREFEEGTIKQLFVTPVNPLYPFLGRISVAAILSFFGMLISIAIVIFGYGVFPVYPIMAFFCLIVCIAICCCVGALLGILLRKILPVASLIFGLALPLYIDSGSLEPERFDGNSIWALAHLSPLYYIIGIFEYAFHGFRVTPEPISIDFLAILGWMIGLILLSLHIMKKQLHI